MAEGKVLRLGAGDVQLVGPDTPARVAVGRAQHYAHYAAGWDRHPAHLDVLCR